MTLLAPAQAEVNDGPGFALMTGGNQPGSPASPTIAVRIQGRDQSQRRLPAGLDVSFDIQVANVGGVDLNKVRVSDPAVPNCELAIGHLRAGETVTYRCVDSSGKSGTLVYREFIDRFEQADFANRDGVDSWVGAWQEVDLQGEGPDAGSVRIANGSLRLLGDGDAGITPSITRTLDLDGMDTATMRVDWRPTRGAARSGEMVLEISTDGHIYVEVDRLSALAEGTGGLRSYDITEWISEQTRVRFRALGANGGESQRFEVGSIEVLGQGWTGGEGYTNVVTVSGEDAAGTRVLASAESSVEFVVEDDDDGQVVKAVWLKDVPLERLQSPTPL